MECDDCLRHGEVGTIILESPRLLQHQVDLFAIAMCAPPATSASLVEDHGVTPSVEGVQISNPEAMAVRWSGPRSTLRMR